VTNICAEACVAVAASRRNGATIVDHVRANAIRISL
jgi:hypothetical protein